MNALVTGAAGFVGSQLSRELTRRGHRVIGVDNFSTGSLENWLSFADHAGADLVVANVAKELPDISDIELVFHFASPAGRRDYAERPLQTMRTNAEGLDRCCRLATARGARLIFASASGVYGVPSVHPQHEEYWGNVNPIGARSCFQEAKRYGEALVNVYRRSYGLDGRIVRIFNTYGPGMRRDDGRLIPSFIMAALRSEPIPIFGGGTQTRSLCYIDDLVRGIVDFALLENPLYHVVNLGNDCECHVLEIARTVSDLLGSELRTMELPPTGEDPARSCPDLRRAREMIGWKPATALRDGLMQTIAWYKENHLATI